MYDFLRQHPEIFMSKKKEPHFFGSDLQIFDHPRMSLKEYLSYFSEARDERRLGEGSVWYLYSQRAPFEIKEFCPSASILIMLRNPVDLMYSLHNQGLYSANYHIEDFAAALKAEENGNGHLRKAKHGSRTGDLAYRATARYTRHVERYLDVFGRDNVHIIIYDDLAASLAQVYRQTCEFLGVDSGFRPEFRVVNSNKNVRSRALLFLLKYPPPAAQRLARSLIPGHLRRGLYELVRRINTAYAPRPPMKPELERRLRAEFLPEVEQLSELLDRDLTHWCRT